MCNGVEICVFRGRLPSSEETLEEESSQGAPCPPVRTWVDRDLSERFGSADVGHNPPASRAGNHYPLHRDLRSADSKSHDVVAAIDVENFAGNSTGQIGSQEQGCVAYFRWLHVPFQGRPFGMSFEHLTQAADAARR